MSKREELLVQASEAESSARSRAKYDDHSGAEQLRATAARLRKEADELPKEEW
ncbi:hypothetical protein K2Q00_00215 [Patescibacteria group bacterium]|nr:hypothetical protein [Patescibacteria group bacterium]